MGHEFLRRHNAGHQAVQGEWMSAVLRIHNLWVYFKRLLPRSLRPILSTWSRRTSKDLKFEQAMTQPLEHIQLNFVQSIWRSRQCSIQQRFQCRTCSLLFYFRIPKTSSSLKAIRKSCPCHGYRYQKRIISGSNTSWRIAWNFVCRPLRRTMYAHGCMMPLKRSTRLQKSSSYKFELPTGKHERAQFGPHLDDSCLFLPFLASYGLVNSHVLAPERDVPCWHSGVVFLFSLVFDAVLICKHAHLIIYIIVALDSSFLWQIDCMLCQTLNMTRHIPSCNYQRWCVLLQESIDVEHHSARVNFLLANRPLSVKFIE